MKIYTISLKGLRPQNEDCHNVILNSNGRNKLLNKVDFFSVFDGHGGKEVSNYLSETLNKYFMKRSVTYPLSRKYVKTVYDHVQQKLRNDFKNFSYHTGSTSLVVIFFKKREHKYLNILNTGDCRCVISRDNCALSLTKDHKPHWPEERARIKKLGGEIAYDGYNWRVKDLSVSRAFGDIDSTPYLTHLPDIFQYRLEKTDKFVIIACDGVWDVISNQEAVNFVINNCYKDDLKTRNNSNVNIANELGKHVLNKGSTDNINIIVVFF